MAIRGSRVAPRRPPPRVVWEVVPRGWPENQYRGWTGSADRPATWWIPVVVHRVAVPGALGEQLDVPRDRHSASARTVARPPACRSSSVGARDLEVAGLQGSVGSAASANLPRPAAARPELGR